MARLITHYVCVGASDDLHPIRDGEGFDKSLCWREVPYQPSLLASISTDDELSAKVAVVPFCLPHSLQLFFDLPPPTSFRCFVLTRGDGTRVYGHNLTTYERLPPTTRVHLAVAASMTSEQAPQEEGEPKPTPLESLAGSDTVFAARSFCLFSRSHHPLAFFVAIAQA